MNFFFVFKKTCIATVFYGEFHFFPLHFHESRLQKEIRLIENKLVVLHIISFQRKTEKNVCSLRGIKLHVLGEVHLAVVWWYWKIVFFLRVNSTKTEQMEHWDFCTGVKSAIWVAKLQCGTGASVLTSCWCLQGMPRGSVPKRNSGSSPTCTTAPTSTSLGFYPRWGCSGNCRLSVVQHLLGKKLVWCWCLPCPKPFRILYRADGCVYFLKFSL